MKASEEEQSLLQSDNKVRPIRFSDNDETKGDDGILLSRRIARYFSERFAWYGANGNIDKAWAYFEKITLPRRMKDDNNDSAYVRAPTGTNDKPTFLYPAWTTASKDLADFGTGIAVYFSTMRALILIMVVAGFLYTPTFLYYKSDAYSTATYEHTTRSPFLSGSLICDDTSWVPCPNCTMDEWGENLHRIAHDGNLTFVLRNVCAPLRWQEGVNHLLVVAFLIVAIFVLAQYQKRMERDFDEDELTASDYSIQIDNPPADATDPEEWNRFFSQFGDGVVYVTVALHNEELVNLLVKRRTLLKKIGDRVKGREDTEPLQSVSNDLADLHPRWYKKITVIEQKCRRLMQTQFGASAVFVTFETERTQRDVLRALGSVGKIHIAANNTSATPSEYLFRGNLLLDVFEAVEPSAIRWQDLDETQAVKFFQRIFTYLLTIIIIYGGFITVRHGFEHGSDVAAYEIVILNILVPNLLRFVNLLESHPQEGNYQASLYVKVCAFRWINTAVITMFVKPWTTTLESTSGALIPSVYAVLKAEIITVPIVSMLDIVGNLKRHILAPAAANQAAMNSQFGGAPGFLGEKYTGLTKIVFLCFFYSAIFPLSFFFGALALTMTYFAEKFCLLRSWAPIPKLGNQVARFSRRIFFPLTVLALAIMSEFYWSAYPFDYVCDTNLLVGDSAYDFYAGSHTVVTPTSEGKTFQVNVERTSEVHRFCDQNILASYSALFAFFNEENDDWMSADQITLVYAFGIVCFGIMAAVLLHLFWTVALPFMHEVVGTDYTTDELDSGEKYSDQLIISAYVPQMKTRAFPYPLLACDISGMDSCHIDWVDPIRGHAYYDMAADVQFLSEGKDYRSKPVLSVIKRFNTKVKVSPSTKKGYGSTT